MKSFIEALKAVSRLRPSAREEEKSETPSPWELVLAKSLLALCWTLAGGLVLWLVPGDRMVAALLGTLAALALRFFLCPHFEMLGLEEASGICSHFIQKEVTEKAYAQAIFQLLLCVRPACILLLLLHGNWLWPLAAAALGMAVAVSFKTGGYGHWTCACAIALASGAILSKAYAQFSGMFLVSALACVFCWLLSISLDRLDFRHPGESRLFIGETAALLLGLVAQAI